MATITASATGGNYSATTAWVGGVVPGINDDVKLDATSGNITLDTSATNLCKTFDCTGYTGTLTLAASQTFTVSGNLFKLVSGMTFTLNSTIGSIYFTDTAADTVDIYTGGKTMPNVNFGQGATLSSATWNLNDAWSFPSTTITHTCGTLTTNNNNLTGNTMQAGGNNVRTQNLGSSVITLTSGTFGWNFSNATSQTMNAGTSSIIINGGSGFQGGNLTYYDVSITGAGIPQLAGINTFHNFTRTGSATTGDGLTINNQNTVTGTLTLTGNSVTNRLFVSSFAYFGATFVANGTVSLTNVDFNTVIGGGTSAPWSGTSIGNAGNNQNITFTSAKNVYWVGGTGNTNDTAHLSLTSGGSSGANYPLPQDTLVFDANSFSTTGLTVTTVTTGVKYMPSMDWSAATNSPTWAQSAAVTTYGNLVLNASMTTSGTSTFTFGGGNSTINSAGNTISFAIAVNGGNATNNKLTLLSNTTQNSARSFTLTSGTLDLNGYTLSPGTFVSNGTSTRVLTFGSGTISMQSTGTIWNTSTMTGMTVNRGTGTITFTNTSATSKTLSFNGGSWPALVTPASNSGTTIITSAAAVTFDNATFGKSSTYSFGASQTFKFKALTATGSSGQLVTFISGTSGTAAIFDFIGIGIPTVSYASIKDNNPVQTGTWFAGTNSTAVSNTGNWVFGNGTAAIFTANMGFAADEPKQTSKNLVAGMSFGGLGNMWLFRQIGSGLSFLGGLASKAMRSRQVSGSLGFLGNLASNLVSGLKVSSQAGTLSFLGVLTKSVTRGVSSTLSSVGALFLQQHLVRAGLSFAGNLKKKYGRALSSGLTFSGDLTRGDTYKAIQLNSTLSFSQRQVATGDQYEIGDVVYGDNNYGQLPATTNQPVGSLAVNYIKSKGLSFIGNLAMFQTRQRVLCWNGSSWQAVNQFSVWNGSSWVNYRPRIWNGSDWVLN